ncbi:hypothetical protein BDK51DRAFT_49108 [Blyttiomyces helicus]|uniref:Uncharacterized protein n=1 Tax=Blyttiomyces helicus TaxID=388810 RepID=A0A4P9W2V6_9FUNG|nr:hypothetical protein BDK51DRAFT_49108 [Blyttiomyces helicus]|eukprot:RKO84396.1 hypothetical protein BDK51DRAFT_49108 [Blyttiomyces helicus]
MTLISGRKETRALLTGEKKIRLQQFPIQQNSHKMHSLPLCSGPDVQHRFMLHAACAADVRIGAFPTPAPHRRPSRIGLPEVSRTPLPSSHPQRLPRVGMDAAECRSSLQAAIRRRAPPPSKFLVLFCAHKRKPSEKALVPVGELAYERPRLRGVARVPGVRAGQRERAGRREVDERPAGAEVRAVLGLEEAEGVGRAHLRGHGVVVVVAVVVVGVSG